jgi:acetolactate synthase I/II/III large subunit
MRVAEAVGRQAAGLAGAAGQAVVFGVVGSGNFHLTNAMIAAGARFVAARHEGGAAVMADAWARTTGRTGLVSVHQGPGLTNAMTGIAEAAKSRTPLVVLAAEATERKSNFYLDVAGLARAVGAEHVRLRSPETAMDEVRLALATAASRRTVIFSVPLDVQAAEYGAAEHAPVGPVPAGVEQAEAVRPAADSVTALADVLRQARRPVFIAGRGARGPGARAALTELAEVCGALLATSAVASGLFTPNPWNLGVSGGFASPLTAELIAGADVIVAWGCSLNMWTTRHGALIGADATVVQIDDDPGALGAHRKIHLGVHGDVTVTARAAAEALGGPREAAPAVRSEVRTPALRKRIAAEVRWRDVPYADEGGAGLIDPRTLTIALDDMLPAERTVAVDSGNFMGYPSMYLSVPAPEAFVFTQAFQSIGLGLASAIGAAVARPGRLTVAALGDGGALMGISEMETAVRLGLPLVVVVYDDEAYGAEVHHFGPDGHDLGTVRFPPADIAAIGRGFGCDGITVRSPGDLRQARAWLDGPRDRPLVIDAKVTSGHGSWWLEEAFRGH